MVCFVTSFPVKDRKVKIRQNFLYKKTVDNPVVLKFSHLLFDCPDKKIIEI